MQLVLALALALALAAKPVAAQVAQSAPPSAAAARVVASEPLLAAAVDAPDTAAAPPLAALVERAWSRERAAAIRDARAAELDARTDATRAAFPDAPSIGVDLRRDLPPPVRLPGTESAAGRGRNELEPSVSVPLWLPGQRDAQRRVIARERARLEAGTRLERLRVAGEVREAAWAVAFAQADLALQQGRLASARALEADVARRVGAGDLAPVDRALARTETLAADVALREARGRHAQAIAELRRLAGVDAAGEIAETPADTPLTDEHPALAALREAAETGRARLALAAATRRDNPTLSAAARFDRDVYGAAYRNTLRIGISLPLDTDARNAPRIAAASAELTEAEIAFERRRRVVAVEVERARIALAAAREALAANAERADAARDATAAIERAFRAGERGLPELLRVRAQLLDAERARDTARVQAGLAAARLNQSLGIHP